ncbi:hypothetical protein [Rhizobium leguminosarum]|uniref:hypothetical protein n=1 Tax=Rhizobium leguminosarum TaxID=384 RepID=UPI0013DA96CE|nr:hypothetical protein [Rhizobium leguminosarum]
MKTSRFSEPQILAILRQAEGGVKAEPCDAGLLFCSHAPKMGLSQISPLNPMLTIRREFAAPKVAERTDDSECHSRKAEAPVEG